MSRSDFSEMFKRQVSQQRNWYSEALSLPEKRRIAKDLLLGLHEEVAELQRLMYRSFHILRSAPPERSSVLKEIVDVMKSVLSLADLEGLTSDELVSVFWEVSHAVDDKWRCEQVNLSDEMVLITDLDCCVADFWGGFIAWMQDHTDWADEGWIRENMNAPEMEGHKHMFYAAGGFKKLPVIRDASWVLNTFKKMGVKIVVLTARPRRRYPNVEVDTIQWCRQHQIEYDLLLFNRDKAEAICQHILPARILAFIEDRVKHAMEVASLRIPVLRLVGSVEEEEGLINEHPYIQEVHSWKEIKEALHERLLLNGRKANGTESHVG